MRQFIKRFAAILLTLILCASAAMTEGWTWTSSDENIIRVWPDGSLVVSGIGTATLTGETDDGSTVMINVTVPEDFATTDSKSPYIGNRNTKKFHHFNCTSVNDMKGSNKVSLSSREDAIDKGYAPCGRCDP